MKTKTTPAAQETRLVARSPAHNSLSIAIAPSINMRSAEFWRWVAIVALKQCGADCKSDGYNGRHQVIAGRSSCWCRGSTFTRSRHSMFVSRDACEDGCKKGDDHECVWAEGGAGRSTSWCRGSSFTRSKRLFVSEDGCNECKEEKKLCSSSCCYVEKNREVGG